MHRQTISRPLIDKALRSILVLGLSALSSPGLAASALGHDKPDRFEPEAPVQRVACCLPPAVGPGAPSLPAPYLGAPAPAPDRTAPSPSVSECAAQLTLQAPAPGAQVTCVPSPGAPDGSGAVTCLPSSPDASPEARTRGDLARARAHALGCR